MSPFIVDAVIGDLLQNYDTKKVALRPPFTHFLTFVYIPIVYALRGEPRRPILRHLYTLTPSTPTPANGRVE